MLSPFIVLHRAPSFASPRLSRPSRCTPFAMGVFWTRSSSTSATSSAPADASSSNHVANMDDTDTISVKPAPIPAKALATPFPTQWQSLSNAEQRPELQEQEQTPDQHSASGSNKHGARIQPSHPVQMKHNPLPHMPFVPSPDHNPDLDHKSRYTADPSSILLRYPRTNIDHTHDFYDLYNPPETRTWKLVSTMVMCGVAAVSKTFMTFGAYSGVHNMNPFLKILYDPNRTRPILTVTNHSSTADDPLLWGALPWKCYWTPTKTIRYALGAQELCYFNKPVAAFFRYGQIVPIIRGNGIYQPAIDKSIDLLRSGKWVHIFPEGKINQSSSLIRLKWGVGRVLMEYGGLPLNQGGKPMDEVEMPIVIPIYHLGMEDILRLYPNNDSPVFPKLGLPLTIVFGEPVEFGEIMKEYKEGKIGEVETRIKMTDRVFDALEELRVVALRLQKEQADRAEEDRIRKGRWWWIQPAGWGWWRSPDIELYPQNRDTTVKIEDI